MVTVMSTNAVPVLVEFVPVMVKVVLGIWIFEAPEIIPVVLSKFNPAGNPGLMLYELTTVPNLFGTSGVIATVS